MGLNYKKFKELSELEQDEIKEKIKNLTLKENKTQTEIAKILNFNKRDYIGIIQKELGIRLSRAEVMKRSFQRKYGVDNPGQLDSVKNKIKQTNLEKYGGHPNKLQENKDRIRNTQIKKYGCLAWNTEKQRQTCLEKYGNASSLHGTNQERTNNIFIKKYGYKAACKNDVLRKKISETHKFRINENRKRILKICSQNNKVFNDSQLSRMSLEKVTIDFIEKFDKNLRFEYQFELKDDSINNNRHFRSYDVKLNDKYLLELDWNHVDNEDTDHRDLIAIKNGYEVLHVKSWNEIENILSKLNLLY